MTIGRHIAAALLVGLWLPVLLVSAPQGRATEGKQPDAAAVEARKQARQAEYDALRRSIEVSKRRQAALQSEIEGLDKDSATLNSDLLATGARLRSTEEQIATAETRLEQMHDNQDEIRRSLHERRDVMAEVLAALQRMGRTPPPALLSRPEDALAAIRGSIIAGAVLPDIRIEAELLAADLEQLTTLTARIETERDFAAYPLPRSRRGAGTHQAFAAGQAGAAPANAVLPHSRA